MKFIHEPLRCTEAGLATVSTFVWTADADFAVTVGDEKVFEEPGFLVVELAIGLRRWLDDGFKSGAPYDYRSVEFQEVGVIYLHPTEVGEWRFGSVLEPGLSHIVSGADVESAVSDFFAEIDSEVSSRFGIDLKRAYDLP